MPIQKDKTPGLSLRSIQDKGWSLRTAAVHLGVHWTHLHKVIRGERTSFALSRRIKDLPSRSAKKKLTHH